MHHSFIISSKSHFSPLFSHSPAHFYFCVQQLSPECGSAGWKPGRSEYRWGNLATMTNAFACGGGGCFSKMLSAAAWTMCRTGRMDWHEQLKIVISFTIIEKKGLTIYELFNKLKN